MTDLNQSKNKHLQQAFRLLDAHFSNPDFTVKEWATQLNITVPYLSKLLRDNTGNAASWHIRDRRLHRAKELLKQGNTPIFEVATASGFSENNYFSRVFKQKINSTPTEWREAYTKKGNLSP
jgi:AraC-like DNA-binding protein